MQTSGQSQLHFGNLTNKPTTVSGYGITDAMTTSHAANAITSTNITNWNTAYGWGNHAGLYRPISYVPAWTEVTGKPSFATVATSGSYNDLTDKPVTDGSETKLTAGSNVTITGSGTTASPYVISSTGGSGAAHYVGELYGGGVVFYVDQTGSHGLICSAIDIGTVVWSNVSSTLIGSSAQSLWNGQGNTTAIISQSGHTTSAAKLCDNYTNANYGSGIYSDWYLPSLTEFRMISNNLYIIQKVLESDGNSSTIGFTIDDSYWTSRERSDSYAAAFLVYDNSIFDDNKAYPAKVRAVRAF